MRKWKLCLPEWITINRNYRNERKKDNSSIHWCPPQIAAMGLEQGYSKGRSQELFNAKLQHYFVGFSMYVDLTNRKPPWNEEPDKWKISMSMTSSLFLTREKEWPTPCFNFQEFSFKQIYLHRVMKDTSPRSRLVGPGSLFLFQEGILSMSS